ncbi:xanthine dehydrogenase family protein molybdopterin-binding subunit [Acuticoccus kandeliae]|uniref:xanthine dehydrogenase family protein molybdopterin-binding subunit n=1 Tax=Acuticoccus kandeliae TaxID=2073160 RepID=UPI000D3E2A31|nr:xanthine dehydrogenase family protein molybdopterin-binding subunit [Acuticoccus kandeliae]
MSDTRPVFRHIGRPVPRQEDSRLLRGYGAYVDDLPEPPGTLYLGCVRSPVAHARITSIDLSEALSMPGVVAGYTAADLTPSIRTMEPDRPKPGYKATFRDVMPTDRVRYVGDTVAVILAEDPYLLEDALETVLVDYEALPVVVSIEDAIAEGATAVHDDIADNIPFAGQYKTEGFDAAFASAHLVVKDTFRSARMAGVSLEPRGVMASYDKGKGALTLWSSTQIPHLLRTSLGELLDMAESQIRVVAPDVGGGFGIKAHVYPEEVIAAALARRLGGTIKWVGDRQDDFVTSTHSRDYRYDVEMALARDGTILAVRNRLHVNIGAYACFPFGSSAEAGGGAIYLPGAYKFAHYAFETHSVFTNTAPVGVYRGVAAPIAHFAQEGLIDRAAAALGIDKLEMRRKNLVQPEDLPFTNAAGISSDTQSHAACLEEALAAIDYEGFRRDHPRGEVRDGKRYGIGIACITEHTGQGASRYRTRGLHRVPGFEGATVRMESDGRLVAAVSQSTQGQGHLTVFAQIIAEHLGVDPGEISVEEGDTATSPFGSGTFASRAAVVAGGAVFRASETLAAKLKRIAGFHLEVAPDDIELTGGEARVAGADMAMSFRELAAIAHSLEARPLPEGEDYGLESRAFYDPPNVSIANAVHIAVVSVDVGTGRVAVERYAVAHDCGRMINPMLVAGQVHGGVAQGIGEALMEGVVYDEEGQLLTTQLLDYLLPSSCDIPDIAMVHIESETDATLGGFKGAGEGGVIGAVPAVAGAVNDALAGTGAFVNRLPLRPESILALLKSGAE